jgi:hypothetical protein
LIYKAPEYKSAKIDWEHPDFDPSETNSCSDLMRMVILSIFCWKKCRKNLYILFLAVDYEIVSNEKKRILNRFLYLLSLSFNGFEYVED